MKKVLCVDWGAHGIGDVTEAMSCLGLEPAVAHIAWDDIMNNPGFAEAFGELLDPGNSEKPDLVFTHNFFPSISDACRKTGTPYLSLVFDSPHMTLTSRAAENEVNHIWLFDRRLKEYLEDRGRQRLRHTVLPASLRMKKQAEQVRDGAYEHDVCFLGSLYQRDYIFYDQIGYLPPALKGFLDGVIEAGQHVFGYDMAGDRQVLPEDRIREMGQYVKFDMSGDYQADEDLLLRDMLRKKITSLERYRVLERLGKRFVVDVYTTPSSRVPANVRNLGYADYNSQMPVVFRSSRINLNLTLRTIRSGIPLRVMDILSSGGFLISDWREELAEYFREGEEVEMARTAEELEDKIAWYLEHDDERETIAKRGQQAAFERFSADKVFAAMLAEIGYAD